MPAVTLDLDGLTAHQRRILDCLIEAHLHRLPQPAIRDLMGRFGYKSPNAVCCHLWALVKKGWIEMGQGHARSIVILKKPSEYGRENILNRLKPFLEPCLAPSAIDALSRLSTDLLTNLTIEFESDRAAMQ